MAQDHLSFPDAIVLAGGLGTRLAGVLPDLPKCLAPVLGRPFLFHLLDRLYAQGVRHVVLSLGFKADRILAAIKAYERPGLELDAVIEPERLGTGGGVRFALDRTRSSDVLVLNGDSFVPFDLGALVRFHEEGGWKASLVSVRLEDASRFGLLTLGPSCRVEAFLEKRPNSQGPINAGVYLFKREVLATLAQGKPLSLEQDLFPGLATVGGLGALCVQGSFLDIGTPSDYARAEGFFGKDRHDG